jgi:prepilin-type processing-associated H-X9-DG protein/prepilin-type N-terminal cleavage/methylation domain-containing protein
MVRARSRTAFAPARTAAFTPAFTLVELLVVIGIIALLISILLPSLTKARAAANETACMSQLRQFGIGAQMYADSSRGQLPQKGPDGSAPGQNSYTPAGGVLGFDDPSIWFNAIPPLVTGKSYFQMLLDAAVNKTSTLPRDGDHSLFICPAMGPSVGAGAYDRLSGPYFLLYGTEDNSEPVMIPNSTGLAPTGQFAWASSYAFNSKMTVGFGQTTETAVKMSMLRPSSEYVLMVEKINSPGEYKIKAVQDYNNLYRSALNNDVTAAGFVNSNVAQTKADWRRFTTRHNGGGNILFADGHVQWFSWTSVQIQPSEMPGGTYNPAVSNANQPGKIRWSILDPTN